MDGEIGLVIHPFGLVMDISSFRITTLFSMEYMGMVILIQETIMAMASCTIDTETLITEGEIIITVV